MVAVSHALLETVNIPKEFQPGMTGVAVGSHVRFGSKADIEAPPTDVRFTPKSRHGDVRLSTGSTRQNDRTALSTSGHDHAKQRWQ